MANHTNWLTSGGAASPPRPVKEVGKMSKYKSKIVCEWCEAFRLGKHFATFQGMTICATDNKTLRRYMCGTGHQSYLTLKNAKKRGA